MGFTVFFFLDSFNNSIDTITTNSNSISLLTDEIRLSAVSIIKTQRKLLANSADQEDLESLVTLSEGFQSQLHRLDNYYTDVEIKKVIAQMVALVEYLKDKLGKISLFRTDKVALKGIEELADKILDSFTKFQDIQLNQNEAKNDQIKGIIGETRRNMLITLIITFLATILLGMIMPGKVSLPFKKINDAIREMQDCNFDVSIYYNQNDEIGELASEINKLINNLKTFEELRTERIQVELRKFDALANLSKMNVLVANSEGELIYMNNKLYSLLQIQSTDVVHKDFHDALIPESIKETFNLAIKRRSKIENAIIEISKKIIDDDEDDGNEDDLAFEGFANVIPVRGKESSMDYYLMILSTETFS